MKRLHLYKKTPIDRKALVGELKLSSLQLLKIRSFQFNIKSGPEMVKIIDFDFQNLAGANSYFACLARKKNLGNFLSYNLATVTRCLNE